jgi:hypothetical protein
MTYLVINSCPEPVIMPLFAVAMSDWFILMLSFILIVDYQLDEAIELLTSYLEILVPLVKLDLSVNTA